jgi:DNA adenine methylase
MVTSQAAKDHPIEPFLKWPGGKRWLTSYIISSLNGATHKRYFEPFLGGGALFFALRPPRAILSDVNTDLINTYEQVRSKPKQIITALKDVPVDADTYNRLRDDQPTKAFARAVRFLYLNRTAFAGMYRLNRLGGFNVPFGGGQRTPEPLWTRNLLTNAASALRTAELCCGDFEDVLARAGTGDLVYCDPTYTVAHNNNGFVRYNERNFSWDDQKRLAIVCRRLARKGATVVVSNAAHDEILELYRPNTTHHLSRRSTICPTSTKRGSTDEVLLVFSR